MKLTETIEETIRQYLVKNPKGDFGGNIERNCSYKNKPSSVSRVLRYLENEGIIIKSKIKLPKVNAKVVYYILSKKIARLYKK